MLSKEVETFQTSMKHYHYAQSIMMMIVGIMLLLTFIFLNIEHISASYFYSFYMIFFLLMILLGLGLFGLFIYTLVRYILYLTALKAIRSFDPNALYTTAYRLEIKIIKTIIGCTIAGIILFIVLTSAFSGELSWYFVIYLISLIPLSIGIFLALFARVYIEAAAFLIGYIVTFIKNIIHSMEHYYEYYGPDYANRYLISFISGIMVMIIALCMSILIVVFQFKLNRVHFLIKQSIGITSKSVKIKEKEFTFDHLEFGIHMLAGIILLCLFLVETNSSTQYFAFLFGSLIAVLIYLPTAIIVFIGAKTWTNMMTKNRIFPIVTPTTPTNIPIPIYPRNEPLVMSDTVNNNVIDQSSIFFIQCQRCGSKIQDGNAKFCPICGQKLI